LITGGKIIRRSTRKVYNRAADALRLCAQSVPRRGFSWELGRFNGALFRANWRVGYGVVCQRDSFEF
jgi:hypothetical protein